MKTWICIITEGFFITPTLYKVKADYESEAREKVCADMRKYYGRVLSYSLFDLNSIDTIE